MRKNGGKKNGNGNGKRRPMLKTSDKQLVRAVLSSFRKTKESDIEIDERHITEVVEALRVSGFVIVPRGVIDAIRKILGSYDKENES